MFSRAKVDLSKSDLPEIVRGFLAHALCEFPKKKIRFEDFTPEMVKYFSRDDIPGNIRGIENDVVRLVAHTPVDGAGKLDFRNWKKILAGASTSAGPEGLLTYKKIMSSKFDLREGSHQVFSRDHASFVVDELCSGGDADHRGDRMLRKLFMNELRIIVESMLFVTDGDQKIRVHNTGAGFKSAL